MEFTVAVVGGPKAGKTTFLNYLDEVEYLERIGPNTYKIETSEDPVQVKFVETGQGYDGVLLFATDLSTTLPLLPQKKVPITVVQSMVDKTRVPSGWIHPSKLVKKLNLAKGVKTYPISGTEGTNIKLVILDLLKGLTGNRKLSLASPK